MRRLLLLLLSVLFITGLFGCSQKSNSVTKWDSERGKSWDFEQYIERDTVSTLNNWKFQYNEGSNDYSLFFAFFNKEGYAVASDATVEARIVDDNGNELFNSVTTISKDDFGYYTNSIQGEQYLANVRIPESLVARGTSTSGTVFLKIYKTNEFEFNEVNCKALYCLPVKPVTLTTESLPFELDLKDYSGKLKSKIVIEKVTYSFDTRYTSRLEIDIAGIKTYGDDSSYDMFGYKLYDSQGYMVDSGTVSLSRLAKGDKFKDSTISFYEAVPGEDYTIKFTESW